MPRARDLEAMKFFIIPQSLSLWLMGEGIVWAILLKEPLEVDRGQSCPTLATARDSHDEHHGGAAFLLVDTAVITSCG
jgi:hypothetical protein